MKVLNINLKDDFTVAKSNIKPKKCNLRSGLGVFGPWPMLDSDLDSKSNFFFSLGFYLKGQEMEKDPFWSPSFTISII